MYLAINSIDVLIGSGSHLSPNIMNSEILSENYTAIFHLILLGVPSHFILCAYVYSYKLVYLLGIIYIDFHAFEEARE